MVSKDAIRQVAGAWYGFSAPITGTTQETKKESLFEKVQRLNMQHKKDPIKHDGKEG